MIIDPALRWWIAADGEYWHETAGIFVRNPGGEYLLFRRTKFPFGLTVPAGHIEVDETPAAAAERELSEETGLSGRALDGLGDVDLVGDSCRRGADIHRWHVFITEVDEHTDVAINDEGTEPVWLTPSSLAGVELTPAVTMLVERYRRHLG
ncbi:8-oxo-dGTP pyrophosphatase MutT (NUDIX family) [Kibdelosporangium banguiense]|uniref:8-oxo-dGTP pyrophosphatase MutT (NUDIX family) n=1 Tax=Kibdelosporangium banguiense TaxID=1365924 RepID=A0ABS4U1V6_9PSEU|nr:NUDIX hydrolase [Kibdelosporangium banguiense]MBP2330648.1 8-oxo-dGTP pyrophosphatase MutT (NUDIX family) [Kibdelosporangium banguiense]